MKKTGLILILLVLGSFFTCCSLPQKLPKPPLTKITIDDRRMPVDTAKHQFIPKLLAALDYSHTVKRDSVFETEFKEKIMDRIESGEFKYTGVQKLGFKDKTGSEKGSGLDVFYERKEGVDACIIIRFWANNNSEMMACYSPRFKAYANRDKVYEDSYVLITTLSTLRARKGTSCNFKKATKYNRPWDGFYGYHHIGDFNILDLERAGLPVTQQEIGSSSILYFESEADLQEFASLILTLFPNVSKR